METKKEEVVADSAVVEAPSPSPGPTEREGDKQQQPAPEPQPRLFLNVPAEKYQMEFQGQKQHNIPLGKLSQDWARGICERLTQLASTSKAPLASNGYDYFGRMSLMSIGGSDEFDQREYQGRAKYLYTVDTLYEAMEKLKVVIDRSHRVSSPSLFQSNEHFRQVGSKSYYQPDLRDLMEYGCSVIPKCLPILSGLDLCHEYADLGPKYAQIGADDVVSSSFYRSCRERGVQVMKEDSIQKCRKYCRRGVPAELRSRLWAASLGVKIDVISNTKKRWLASLHKRRKMSKLLVEKMVEADVNAILDCDHYFPFDDILKSTLLAFLLDEKVFGMCKGEESSRPKLYGFGESGTNHGLYPPCGVIPFREMSWYAAPLTFLFGFQPLSTTHEKHNLSALAAEVQERQSQSRPSTSVSQSLKSRSSQIARERRKSESVLQKSQEKQRKELTNNAKQVEDHARCYFIFRALYCRYFGKLHSGPYDPTCGLAPSLLGLCQLFETLMEETEPEVNYHLYGIIGISPLALAFPWIVHAFADVLVPEQALLLWDRIVGFDSLIPLVPMAVSVFHYRKRELLECQTMSEVNLFLHDGFKQVLVVPFLQNFMIHMESVYASRGAVASKASLSVEPLV